MISLSNSTLIGLLYFNHDSYGIQPSESLNVPGLAARETFTTSLSLNNAGTKQDMDPVNNIQIALKNNLGVYYFATLLPEMCL
jgi:hypothetical protein